MKNLAATFAGTYKGKKAYRFPVIVRLNNSRLLGTVAEHKYSVLSLSAKDAANYIRDQYADRPETEVIAYGPFGGETYRFIGWHSAIGHQLFNRPEVVQLPLF